MINRITFIGLITLSLMTYAGGNPEHVAFPTAYQDQFTRYDTRNRTNGKQVAVLYANQIAMNSVPSDKLAPGSKIVMEVYKTIPGEDNKPLTDEDGLFQKGPLAAVAVMEKSESWPSGFASDERAGNWGFAIYNTDGTPKANNLECATCHSPYKDNNYMFSYSSLKAFQQQ